LNNEICIDKCCRNAKDNFTEFYTNLKTRYLKISDAQDTHNAYVNADVLPNLCVQQVRYIQ
ncbi:MAG: hypothetical protein IKJ60_04055, partial [Ruminococcus sp.]|nr:hypothetical protein [Ruminococcus sp.]